MYYILCTIHYILHTIYYTITICYVLLVGSWGSALKGAALSLSRGGFTKAQPESSTSAQTRRMALKNGLWVEKSVEKPRENGGNRLKISENDGKTAQNGRKMVEIR